MGSDALLSLCGEWWRARRGGRLLFMRSSSIMALISSIIEAALARPLFPGRFSSSATASGISRSVDRLPCRLAAAAGAAAAASGCAGEVGTAGEAGEKAWLRREDRPRTSFCIAVAAVSASASIFSIDATSTPGRAFPAGEVGTAGEAGAAAETAVGAAAETAVGAAAGAAAAASGCAGEMGTAGEAGEKAWLRREDRPRTSFCMDVAAVSACASIASIDAT